MTDQYRATPEQWAKCEHDAHLWSGAFNCILELRARVEALEGFLLELTSTVSSAALDAAGAINDHADTTLATPPAATREAEPLPKMPTLRSLLHPAYEPGDGSADGAQIVDGEWSHPIMGCDSLQGVVDNARAVLKAQSGGIERCHRLQQENHRFREPERTILCDILANGTLLPDPEGKRYGIPQAGLTDEQLLELMPQQFRDDLATVSRLASYDTPVGPGLYRVSLNTGALAFARAVLARWGGAAVPAADKGEEQGNG